MATLGTLSTDSKIVVGFEPMTAVVLSPGVFGPVMAGGSLAVTGLHGDGPVWSGLIHPVPVSSSWRTGRTELLISV
ncbi:unnamed protein product [Gadus morhua 'NCC']